MAVPGVPAGLAGLAVPTILALALAGAPAGCASATVHVRPTAAPVPAPRAKRPPVQTALPPGRPTIRTIELGRSVKGAPLVLEIFGDGPDAVFIFGGIHGSEPTSAALARSLANRLRINWDLFAGRTVAILAEANPDGLAKRRRTNANRVDLNRNFPAENWRPARGAGRRNGSAPASEPETQAIMRATELVQPRRILSIHSTWHGRHCNNYDGPAEHLAKEMARCNGYPVRARTRYATPGSFGSWAGIDRGIPTITLELPRDFDAAQCWRENSAALLAFVQAGGERPDG
ncbi:MAG: DUF2817 domain-containing protein [Phycisphaerae bacterium]